MKAAADFDYDEAEFKKAQEWFKANPHNFILEGTTALALALLIVAFCLLTSNILRVSPFLKKWLFGRES